MSGRPATISPAREVVEFALVVPLLLVITLALVQVGLLARDRLQEDERRKLERNLHDGAQQQLGALAVKLRLAESLAERDPSHQDDAHRSSDRDGGGPG